MLTDLTNVASPRWLLLAVKIRKSTWKDPIFSAIIVPSLIIVYISWSLVGSVLAY